MTVDEIRNALYEGSLASLVLLEVLRELSTRYHCPEAAGYDGPETFSDCGRCASCLAKRIFEGRETDTCEAQTPREWTLQFVGNGPDGALYIVSGDGLTDGDTLRVREGLRGN